MPDTIEVTNGKPFGKRRAFSMSEHVAETLNKKSTSMSTSETKKVDVDVDRLLSELRLKVRDQDLGRQFVKKISQHLPISEIYSIAEFAQREGRHPGKLFVSVCSKEIRAVSRSK